MNIKQYILTISFCGLELPMVLPLDMIKITNDAGVEVLRWTAD